ncbi:MAG: CehA/McbA family metallohydrolase [Defluviitaleaceae bacterium]|nr:CehA/McbA family metallohydrolase [Defluviitaleaceae bacterium]
MLTTDKKNAAIGEKFFTTLRLDNLKKNEKISATLITSATNSVTFSPEKTAQGASVFFTWETEIIAGGLVSVKAVVKINDDDEILFFCENPVSVPFEKAGWYKIDGHIHSDHSDGAGTVSQNFSAARKNGINSPALTDHWSAEGWNDSVAFMNENPDTFVICGNEFTSDAGHAVLLGINESKNYDLFSFCELISRAKSMNALIYIAHPFETVFKWRHGFDAEGYNGIEVWNNWWGSRHSINKQAFEKWDALNKNGKKLFGIAATDAHKISLAGSAFSSVYLPNGLSAANLLRGMESGNMYGSNGPHLEFSATANGVTAIMGETLEISQHGEDVALNIKCAFGGGLNRLLIIKNGNVVQTLPINARDFDTKIILNVAPTDFVRVETEGFETATRKLNNENDAIMSSDGICAAFAFSNPIFFDCEKK